MLRKTSRQTLPRIASGFLAGQGRSLSKNPPATAPKVSQATIPILQPSHTPPPQGSFPLFHKWEDLTKYCPPPRILYRYKPQSTEERSMQTEGNSFSKDMYNLLSKEDQERWDIQRAADDLLEDDIPHEAFVDRCRINATKAQQISEAAQSVFKHTATQTPHKGHFSKGLPQEPPSQGNGSGATGTTTQAHRVLGPPPFPVNDDDDEKTNEEVGTQRPSFVITDKQIQALINTGTITDSLETKPKATQFPEEDPKPREPSEEPKTDESSKIIPSTEDETPPPTKSIAVSATDIPAPTTTPQETPTNEAPTSNLPPSPSNLREERNLPQIVVSATDIPAATIIPQETPTNKDLPPNPPTHPNLPKQEESPEGNEATTNMPLTPTPEETSTHRDPRAVLTNTPNLLEQQGPSEGNEPTTNMPLTPTPEETPIPDPLYPPQQTSSQRYYPPIVNPNRISYPWSSLTRPPAAPTPANPEDPAIAPTDATTPSTNLPITTPVAATVTRISSFVERKEIIQWGSYFYTISIPVPESATDEDLKILINLYTENLKNIESEAGVEKLTITLTDTGVMTAKIPLQGQEEKITEITTGAKPLFQFLRGQESSFDDRRSYDRLPTDTPIQSPPRAVASTRERQFEPLFKAFQATADQTIQDDTTPTAPDLLDFLTTKIQPTIELPPTTAQSQIIEEIKSKLAASPTAPPHFSIRTKREATSADLLLEERMSIDDNTYQLRSFVVKETDDTFTQYIKIKAKTRKTEYYKITTESLPITRQDFMDSTKKSSFALYSLINS